MGIDTFGGNCRVLESVDRLTGEDEDQQSYKMTNTPTIVVIIANRRPGNSER